MFQLVALSDTKHSQIDRRTIALPQLAQYLEYQRRSRHRDATYVSQLYSSGRVSMPGGPLESSQTFTVYLPVLFGVHELLLFAVVNRIAGIQDESAFLLQLQNLRPASLPLYDKYTAALGFYDTGRGYVSQAMRLPGGERIHLLEGLVVSPGYAHGLILDLPEPQEQHIRLINYAPEIQYEIPVRLVYERRVIQNEDGVQFKVRRIQSNLRPVMGDGIFQQVQILIRNQTPRTSLLQSLFTVPQEATYFAYRAPFHVKRVSLTFGVPVYVRDNTVTVEISAGGQTLLERNLEVIHFDG